MKPSVKVLRCAGAREGAGTMARRIEVLTTNVTLLFKKKLDVVYCPS